MTSNYYIITNNGLYLSEDATGDSPVYVWVSELMDAIMFDSYGEAEAELRKVGVGTIQQL